MARWLLAVETNCTGPSRETEFNEWHDNIHLADGLKLPGILSGTRYKNSIAGEGQGKYLAPYEMETEDMKQTIAALPQNVGTLCGDSVPALARTDKIGDISQIYFQICFWLSTGVSLVPACPPFASVTHVACIE